jgi:hypothetical protein
MDYKQALMNQFPTLAVDTFWQGKRITTRRFHASNRSLAEWYMRQNNQRGFTSTLREV